nr:hypothetical protein [Bradyrhizobium symbiodeficiens]
MQGADLLHALAGMTVVQILDGKNKAVSPRLENLLGTVDPSISSRKPVPDEFKGLRRFLVVVRIGAGQNGQGTFGAVDLRKLDQECVERRGQPRCDLIVPGKLDVEKLGLHDGAVEGFLSDCVLSEDLTALREHR